MQLDLWRLVSGVGVLLGQHSDLIASSCPRDIWADVHLSRLRCVPPVVTAIAMAAAHCFVRAINSFLGRHNMDAE